MSEIEDLRAENKRLRDYYDEMSQGYKRDLAELRDELTEADTNAGEWMARLRKVRLALLQGGQNAEIRWRNALLAIDAEPAEETDLLPGRSPAADVHDDTGAVQE